jgi:transcriptional regulator with GAF, ATPase, and Fis domain
VRTDVSVAKPTEMTVHETDMHAPDDLTRDLKNLALYATERTDLDGLLARALDYLSGVIPYDLAAVLELVDGALNVRCARGKLASARVRAHRIELRDFPSVRMALETRRTRVLEQHDHQGEGDPYDGVLDLPDGHACMVVPLFAGDRTLGAITFDRSECAVYEPPKVDIATIYGQIIALAMVAAEQAALLDRQRQRLAEENRMLRDETGHNDATALLTQSEDPQMIHLRELAKQVAVTDAPVLVRGETGTGKEVLARAIHAWSARRDAPFVKLNCAALPESLIESELFGHTRGAFTGADAPRPGRFAVANGGTLLLDEIGDLPLPAQAKLLRVLQEGTLEPVGSDRTLKVDVRIVAATNVDLDEALEKGRFRQDLYYRLNVFPIELPPLRARKADIVPIARQHLERLAKATGRGPWSLTKRALERISSYDWPGNVRELINYLDRAAILTPSGELDVEIPKGRKDRRFDPSSDPTSWPTLSEVEKDYVERVLAATEGKIYGPGGSAEILGLKPSTLQSRMAKLGISKR